MELRVTENPSERDKQEVYERVLEYNLSKIECKEVKELGIFIEDESGKKIAGLIGITHGKWLEVNYLWVDKEERCKGIGSQLINKAEEIAQERGCSYSFLNTFGFQAKDFYLKLGYNEVFTLEEYPVTGNRYYLIKKII